MKLPESHRTRFIGASLFLAVSSLFAASAQSYDPPEIIEIRRNYNFINAQIDASVYTRLTKEFPYCQGRIDRKREVWFDKNGTYRKYTHSGGSDDSVTFVEYYFDHTGKLDFIFIKHNNVQMLSAELRVYYNDFGRIIRSIQSGDSAAADLWQAISPKPIASFDASYRCD